MNSIFIEDLELVDEYDGPKMAVDFKKFTIYTWNDYYNGDDWDSKWLKLDLKNIPDVFIGFFNKKNTLLDVIHSAIENNAVSYGRLAIDLNALNFDINFDFEIKMPGKGSFLGSAVEDYMPREFIAGAWMPFAVRKVEYGQYGVSFDFLIDNQSIYNASLSAEKWVNFLQSLSRIWKNLFYGQEQKIVLGEKLLFYNNNGKNIYRNYIYLYRIGEQLAIEQHNLIFFIPISRAKEMFDELVKCIVNANHGNKVDNLWKQIQKDWEQPDERTLIRLETGLNKNRHNVFEYIVHHTDNKYLRVAARMSRDYLDDNDMVELLQFITTLPPTQSDRTDSPFFKEIVVGIPASVSSVANLNYQQGYFLAAYLRQKLNLKEGYQNVVAILEALGIYWERKIFCRKILALAIWETGGPRILLNTSAIGENANLERTCLCHELCHILVDRGHSLPLGDLLITQAGESATYKAIERRARAFAAEFLLPRNEVKSFLEKNGGAEASDAIDNLAAHYGVSLELAANQVIDARKAHMSISTAYFNAAKEIKKLKKNAI